MNDEISTCPRCGSGDVETIHQIATVKFYVKCMKCKQEGPKTTTSKAAIEAWNRRVNLVRIKS